MTTLMTKSLAVCAASVLAIASASAQQPLQRLISLGGSLSDKAADTQSQIDDLDEKTDGAFRQYRSLLKEIDGLRSYNEQQRRVIVDQDATIARLDKSIAGVQVIQRQLPALMAKMLDGLEQFVELDAPFHLEERRERIDAIRRTFDNSSVSPSEQLRQVLEAYRIEIDYGKKLDTYQGVAQIDGEAQNVDYLRIGRIAFLYVTLDEKRMGLYNSDTGQFENVPSSFTPYVRKGLRIAKKQAAADVLFLPIAAPKAQGTYK